MSFSVGSLVKARGREWVVLPDSEEEFLVLRPLGGSDDEIAGIIPSLETVESATFAPPDPTQVGDYRSCRLLRDAVRLSSRSCAGPFRSFGRIGIDPRPYQVVPLLMALKLEPIRLLIADDVGVGKTIEACLIARELLDRGEIQRLAVLCPPHLAEQWQAELRDKFHIDAEVVLPSTASTLERSCRMGQSIFEVFPYVVVSMDFIKSDRRRNEFVRSCPEFVIIDEAHTCAFGQERRGGRHQRHQLVSELSSDPNRHIVLVTATPHSGKEDAFRSLISFLDKDFRDLPENLSGPQNEKHRRRLAAHFVQRRRADIEHYMDSNTIFPKREPREESYRLTPEYQKLFERIVSFVRESVLDSEGGRHRQRVRWWSALALLRSVGSSPAAAVSTLKNRAPSADTSTPEEADSIGRDSVMDIAIDEMNEATDVSPGSDLGDESEDAAQLRRKLNELAREAKALYGKKDNKLLQAVDIVKGLLRDGFNPIVFCRFIPTAEYLAKELRERIRGIRDLEIGCVTGELAPADREKRVTELGGHPKRLLVCTDCLSEGINLQDHFDAVVHYDLSWNPTRHEQREGRVDRFGQPKSKVRVVTYYGADNPIDGIVLNVLLRKHQRIRSSLGISVPVPADTEAVVEAIFEGLLLRESEAGSSSQLDLPGFDEHFRPKKEELHRKWDSTANREKRSRTMFAQETLNLAEVERVLSEATSAIGSLDDVEEFVLEVFKRNRAVVSRVNGSFQIDPAEVPIALKDLLTIDKKFRVRFEKPVKDDEVYLNRTHPMVETLATQAFDAALDPLLDAVAKRAGAIRTKQVSKRTTLLLVRYRFDIITRRTKVEFSQLAEECGLLAFEGPPDDPRWLDQEEAESLIAATPDENIHGEQASDFVSKAVEKLPLLSPQLESKAQERAESLLESHRRVRTAARIKGLSYKVTAKLPVDLLGVFIYLPVG